VFQVHRYGLETVHEYLAVSSSGKLVVCVLISSILSPRNKSTQESGNKAGDNEESYTPFVEK
jgi:hypothetical protein